MAAVALGLQIAMALLFVTSGAQKLLHWQEFRGIVAAYRLVPERLAPLAAALLAPLEVLLGVSVLLRRAMPYTVWAMTALLVVFAAAMAINLRRGRTDIHCGCFRSALRQELRWRLVTRNLVCAVALASSTVMPVESERVVWLLAFPAGAALLSLYAALDAVWALDVSRRVALGRG